VTKSLFVGLQFVFPTEVCLSQLGPVFADSLLVQWSTPVVD